MNTNNIIKVKVLMLFRSVEETADIVCNVLQKVGTLVHFPNQKELDTFLKFFSSRLEIFLLANAIDSIRIVFSGEIVEIDFVNPKHAMEKDEIDLSLLELVPIVTKEIGIELITSNPGLIKAGTFEEIKESAPSSITVVLNAKGLNSNKEAEATEPQADWLSELNRMEIDRAGSEDVIDFLL